MSRPAHSGGPIDVSRNADSGRAINETVHRSTGAPITSCLGVTGPDQQIWGLALSWGSTRHAGVHRIAGWTWHLVLDDVHHDIRSDHALADPVEPREICATCAGWLSRVSESTLAVRLWSERRDWLC
jgi:hypothetical protein